MVTFTYCMYLMLSFLLQKGKKKTQKKKTGKQNKGKKEKGKKTGKILGHGDGSVSTSESDDSSDSGMSHSYNQAKMSKSIRGI